MNASRPRQSPPQDLLALVDTELSFASRLGKVTIVLVSLMMTGVIGLLGVTEPSLPTPARIVFAVILAIGVFSSAFALRALGNRGALLARQRVIAGRTAVAFAAMIVLGASIIGFVKGIPAAFAVAGFGVVLLGGTIALLRQENRRLSALTARRQELAQHLKADG